MKKQLCIFFLICFIICGCKKQEAGISPSGNSVRIGVIAPMSGPGKESGDNALLGIRTALQLQPYLTNGDKIELVIKDNRGTPEQTLSVLEKLSSEGDVACVLLMAKSDAVLAVAPVANKLKIPILALIATHPDITKNNSYISQLGFDDNFQGTVAALYVRDEMLINRVAVFSDPGNAHYSLLANEFIRKFSAVGGTIIEHVTTGPDKGDLPKILDKLKNNDVQLLYLAVQPKQVISIAQTAYSIRWKPKFFGSDGMTSSILLQHSDDAGLINGMMETDFYSAAMPTTEFGRKAVAIFKKSFSAIETSYAGLGCEGASILLNALNRCYNKTNRACVNHMLRNTEGFEGLFGRISIHEDGKAERPIFVNTIEDQQMKSLVKVY
ncbi:MAG: ABC transporter substrate-binding protein [Desulfobulbales bacterium]